MCHAVACQIVSVLTKSSHYAVNSIYRLDIQKKTPSPQNVDLTRLRLACKPRLLVQTHKHTDRQEEFAFRQN